MSAEYKSAVTGARWQAKHVLDNIQDTIWNEEQYARLAPITKAVTDLLDSDDSTINEVAKEVDEGSIALRTALINLLQGDLDFMQANSAVSLCHFYTQFNWECYQIVQAMKRGAA